MYGWCLLLILALVLAWRVVTMFSRVIIILAVDLAWCVVTSFNMMFSRVNEEKPLQLFLRPLNINSIPLIGRYTCMSKVDDILDDAGRKLGRKNNIRLAYNGQELSL